MEPPAGSMVSPNFVVPKVRCPGKDQRMERRDCSRYEMDTKIGPGWAIVQGLR